MKRDSAMGGAKRRKTWGALLLLTGAVGCGGGGGASPADAGTPGDGGTSSTKILREEGRALAYTANGLVVVGSTQVNREQSGADLLIRRYTPEGKVDTTFGVGGSLILDYGGALQGPVSGAREQDDRADTVAILADGRILVAGIAQAGTNTEARDFALVRLSPSGQLDPTFNATGRLRVHFGPEGSVDFRAAARSLLPLSDGRFYVGGFISKSGSTPDDDFILLRYKADGTLDTSFTSSGSPPGSWIGGAYTDIESAQGLLLQGTSVVAAGGDDFAAVRILTSGAQDTTFGDNPKKPGLAQSLGGRAQAVAARPGGGFLLAGERQDLKIDGKERGVLKLVAYTANGKLDTGFGTGGVRELTAPADALDVVDVSGLHVFADGGFLVYADVRAEPAVLRFRANGELDTTFGTAGIMRWSRTRLALPLFIRPTTGPKLAVGGNRVFVTDGNVYTDNIIPDGSGQVLFESTGL